MSRFRDVISVYAAKRQEVETALAQSFLVFINAPDDAEDRQGYLVLGSPIPHWSDRYDNFRYIAVGARSADMRDIEELLTLGDSETRSEYSEEGDDYHAIVGARIISEYLKLVLRSPDEPIGLAVETALRDETGELIVVHYDGEYERLVLDRKPWVKYVGGSKDAAVEARVMALVRTHIMIEAFHPDQTDGLLEALRAEFLNLQDIKLWKLNWVVSEDPEPKKLEF